MLGPYAHATHKFFKLGRGYIFERKRWGAGQKYVYYYIKKILMEEREEPEDYIEGLSDAERMALERRLLKTAYDNSFEVLMKNITFEELLEDGAGSAFSTLLAYDPQRGIEKDELKSIIDYYVSLDESEYYLRCAKLQKLMEEKYPE